MAENIKRAHLARAREMYENPETETPGTFEEFFSGQYVDEYGKENQKKKSGNRDAIDRYLGYLANTRGQDMQEEPGLLGRVQVKGKGPYPANQEEDRHLLHQVMKFVHGEEIQNSIGKLLESSPEGLVDVVASTAANVSAKLIHEIRKNREVAEETESSMVTIVAEELWTMAKNMGMKEITPELVTNSIRIAGNTYNQLEEQMKSAQQQPPEQVQGLEGKPAPAQPQQEVQV
jgi:hypothetical protein